MVDKLIIVLGAGLVLWAIGDAIVRIIRASKAPNTRVTKRIEELESDIADLEHDLEESRKRIEVLEKIVTDGRDDLRRQIDDLA